MLKKILYISLVVCFVTACESMQSVKRGLTGQKKNSTDEFLVEKKDPLILPPNYEELPTPDNSPTATDEDGASSFEKTLSSNTEETDESSSSNSSEESILKQIRKK